MKISPENALLVRVEVAAAMLGLGRSQVRKMTEEGTLPPLRQISPGAVGFLKSDLVKWAESRPVIARQSHLVDQQAWNAAAERGDQLMEEVGFVSKREEA